MFKLSSVICFLVALTAVSGDDTKVFHFTKVGYEEFDFEWVLNS